MMSPRKKRPRRRGLGGVLAALASGLLLVASASGENATARLNQDFSDIEIRRIGDFNPGFIEFQDRAIVNAFDVITGAGIEPEAITLVTISTPAVRRGTSFMSGMNFPPYYELWVGIDGCENNIYFRTGKTGNLQTTRDRADCLSGG